MNQSKANDVVKALLVGWSIVFLLYAMLGAWVSTGPHALAGPSSRTMFFAGVLLSFSVLQLVIAIILYQHHKPWLLWVAISCAILSGSMLLGPLLVLPFIT